MTTRQVAGVRQVDTARRAATARQVGTARHAAQAPAVVRAVRDEGQAS